MSEHREAIFREIHDERERQDAKWGEQNHPVRPENDHIFTDFTVIGLREKYRIAADRARELCDKATIEGRLTWLHILQEEFCEAFAEDTPEGQRAELVQVAAVAVSIIECIDRKAGRA